MARAPAPGPAASCRLCQCGANPRSIAGVGGTDAGQRGGGSFHAADCRVLLSGVLCMRSFPIALRRMHESPLDCISDVIPKRISTSLRGRRLRLALVRVVRGGGGVRARRKALWLLRGHAFFIWSYACAHFRASSLGSHSGNDTHPAYTLQTTDRKFSRADVRCHPAACLIPLGMDTGAP